jgi:hypothetical protein
VSAKKFFISTILLIGNSLVIAKYFVAWSINAIIAHKITTIIIDYLSFTKIGNPITSRQKTFLKPWASPTPTQFRFLCFAKKRNPYGISKLHATLKQFCKNKALLPLAKASLRLADQFVGA